MSFIELKHLPVSFHMSDKLSISADKYNFWLQCSIIVEQFLVMSYFLFFNKFIIGHWLLLLVIGTFGFGLWYILLVNYIWMFIEAYYVLTEKVTDSWSFKNNNKQKTTKQNNV